MVNLDSTILPAISVISTVITSFNAFPYSPGFDIKKVAALAESLPKHSWEYGTTAQALLELHNPGLSVFGSAPFPASESEMGKARALKYAAENVELGTGYSALSRGNGAAGDPASLGVSAVLLGKSDPVFAKAAQETADGLLRDVPRFWNGAISHRARVPELWADFMYMAPPFLAYYAADKEDAGLLQESVRQCELYRQILKFNTTERYNGVWMHIIGPESMDRGLWSTGNAWAAAGMTRVLATIMKAPFVNGLEWRQPAIDKLTRYIKEIVDGAMNAPTDDGLLRNYLNDLNSGGHGFGEISGSSLLAATAYRMAVLQPQVFGNNYVVWADKTRAVLSGNDRNGKPHITSTGIVTPAVNPLAWMDTKPFTTGSPEGQAFVVLMYTAWRDCVIAAKCSSSPGGSAEDSLAKAAAAISSIENPEHESSNVMKRYHGRLARHLPHHGSN